MAITYFRLEAKNLDHLFKALKSLGYEIFGPTARDGVIVCDQIQSSMDLPSGWTDEQEKGSYRLKKRNDQAYFGYNLGPHSWKSQLFAPKEKLWSARRRDGQIQVDESVPESTKKAFLGVRACEIAAIGIQDQVFLNSGRVDTHYQKRRESTFVVAVQCTQAAATCFCVSMNSGPKAHSGYDLALTEVLANGEHYFVLQSGSKVGEEVLAQMPPLKSADSNELVEAEKAIEPAHHQVRQMDTSGLKDLLYQNLNHARWDEVAQRCLSCANCTMVCPTCFCSNVEDVTDVTGQHAERWRHWDSCFTPEHSYVHGGSVHASVKSRYRQWMTHKLASWWDQFGSSGCVGCGRCVTWCPVGIDLTEEVSIIRDQQEAVK